MQVTQQLLASRLVAIIRGLTLKEAQLASEGLMAGGMKHIEFTMNTDGALHMIEQARTQAREGIYIGAGTVMNLRLAKEAVRAGAQFLISPNVDQTVIHYALEQGIPMWPGAMTPTEIVNAHEAGADAVKVFPMGSLGLSYLKEIKAPLQHIHMIATGGVTLDNVQAYMEAGASAVGIGSALLPKEALKTGDWTRIAAVTAQFVEAAVQHENK